MALTHLPKAIARASRCVLASGKPNVYAFVLEVYDYDEEEWIYEVMDGGEYKETGNEEKCVAAVWTYLAGHYDEQNNFHESGKLAVEVETY